MPTIPEVVKPEPGIHLHREGRIPPLPRGGPDEKPIAVVWSLYGRPSELMMVREFAERLGVIVSLETSWLRGHSEESRGRDR